jgi:hypothetical protein
MKEVALKRLVLTEEKLDEICVSPVKALGHIAQEDRISSFISTPVLKKNSNL